MLCVLSFAFVAFADPMAHESNAQKAPGTFVSGVVSVLDHLDKSKNTSGAPSQCHMCSTVAAIMAAPTVAIVVDLKRLFATALHKEFLPIYTPLDIPPPKYVI